MRSGALRLLALSLILLDGSSSAGAAGPETRTPARETAGEPRVRLERIFDLRDLEKGRRIARWLGGEVAERRLFARPYGVAWYGEDLVIADPGTGRVVRLASGRPVAVSPARTLDEPIGVAMCGGGVVVTEPRQGVVVLLDARLRPQRRLAEGLRRPTGVACAGGRIFVAETGAHRVVLLEPDGSRHLLGGRGSSEGELNFPTTLALAGGSLWVGDTLNFRLQRLDAGSGAFLGAFGRLGDGPGDMPRVKGVAVDRSGRLWVSDAYLDQVALYAPDGTFLLHLGGSGAGPGELSFPAGIAAHPDGRVAVVDSFNQRVQVFRSLDERSGGD